MEDLLTADGAMDFMRQYNKNNYGVEETLKDAGDHWQEKIEELIENNADDERYEAFELEMTELGVDPDYWCDYEEDYYENNK